MAECEFCRLSTEDKKWRIYENAYWAVLLADRQDYPGRCIVICNKHRESLGELNLEEWISLKAVMTSLERMVKNELGAEMFNWTCLMNNAYKTEPAVPHVHFHFRPRYQKTVSIDGQSFTDQEFGHHYDNNRPLQLDTETVEFIHKKLMESIDKYF